MKLPEGGGVLCASLWFGWGVEPVAGPGQIQKTKGGRLEKTRRASVKKSVAQF
jgi:hypothetical protein